MYCYIVSTPLPPPPSKKSRYVMFDCIAKESIDYVSPPFIIRKLIQNNASFEDPVGTVFDESRKWCVQTIVSLSKLMLWSSIWILNKQSSHICICVCRSFGQRSFWLEEQLYVIPDKTRL